MFNKYLPNIYMSKQITDFIVILDYLLYLVHVHTKNQQRSRSYVRTTTIHSYVHPFHLELDITDSH